MSPTPTRGFWAKLHLSAGLQSAVVAKWALFWAAVSSSLGVAYTQGAFATPTSSLSYLEMNWWTLIVGAAMGVIVGGAIKSQTKANYLNRVEAGTQPAPSLPPVVPAGTTVLSPVPDTVTVAASPATPPKP